MTKAEIEAALQIAFKRCEVVGIPLDIQQKVILLQMLVQTLQPNAETVNGEDKQRMVPLEAMPNPLAELTQLQRQALLQFIQEHNTAEQPWKSQLLNDWLQGQDSGDVQFVREQFGLPWLERVKPVHIAQYAEEMDLKLKVGDRIEVSNSLWEWVQDDGPCCREWYPCTVIAIAEVEPSGLNGQEDTSATSTCCTVRFDNGTEYEIQEMYGWNQYQWRWVK